MKTISVKNLDRRIEMYDKDGKKIKSHLVKWEAGKSREPKAKEVGYEERYFQAVKALMDALALFIEKQDKAGNINKEVIDGIFEKLMSLQGQPVTVTLPEQKPKKYRFEIIRDKKFMIKTIEAEEVK